MMFVLPGDGLERAKVCQVIAAKATSLFMRRTKPAKNLKLQIPRQLSREAVDAFDVQNFGERRFRVVEGAIEVVESGERTF